MELIDRYVAEVGRQLPDKMRPDIEKELRSILEDMLDDRAQAAGKPANEEMTAALLKEYGEPAKVAAGYHAPRYLVGPALYPTFIFVMKAVLGALAIAAVVVFGINIIRPGVLPQEIGKAFGSAFSIFFNGGLTAFGVVTLIFALNERFNPNFKPEKEDWNPRDLKPVDKPSNRIKMGDLIASVVFNLIAIVVFNLYYENIGFFTMNNGEWSFIPVLAEAFKMYIPYLTALWGLEVALHVYVLQAGRWEPLTHWLSIAHAAASVAMLLVILTGPSIVVPAEQFMASWQEAGLTPFQLGGMQQGLDIGVRSVIAIVLIVEVIEMGKQAWSLLRNREA